VKGNEILKMKRAGRRRKVEFGKMED